VSVLSVSAAVNPSLLALAVVAVTVGPLDDTGGTLGVVVAVVACLGRLEEVAEDEEDGADEDGEGLHCFAGFGAGEDPQNLLTFVSRAQCYKTFYRDILPPSMVILSY
jgi:hypothetical protein